MYSTEENIICNCMNISEHEIVYAIKHRDVQIVQDIISAGTGCGSCIPELEEILKRERGF